MVDAARTNNHTWLIVKSSLAIAIGIYVLWISFQMWHEHRMQVDAMQWLRRAEKDATSGWNEDDAANWLKTHGFVEITRGERVSLRQNVEAKRNFVVVGFMEIYSGGSFVGPTSVIITFIFGENHNFEGVEYHVWPFAPT